VPVLNSDVAGIFNRVADLLEIQSANAFRIRAYRNAARTVTGLPKRVSDMVEAGEPLDELPGIGKDLAGKIREIVETGTLSQLEALEKETPPELGEVMQVPGLGGKKVAALHKELGISSVQELKENAQEGQIRNLEGFGKKTEENILEEIEEARDGNGRKLGVKKNLKINEYGVFKNEERIAGKKEEEVYRKVDLPYIDPELREDDGEIEAAQKGKLPSLVTLDDIRGDLHAHTKDTDGHNTLQEMAEAAGKRGYEYLAITEHSKRVTMVGGFDAAKLEKQIKAIEKINGKLKGVTVLKGIEVDILKDGSLDLPDEILKELDVVVCSVHYDRNLTKKQMTERIMKAMDNRYFNILAHPTGRLINERAPYEVDLEKVMEKAGETGCFLEVNAHPDRLDLSDRFCRMAKEAGVKLVVSTDAHSTTDLEFMRFGMDQARRGWLEAEDVINTRSLKDLRKLLRR
jgi:histidinol phosphatase-like PHP family hydrolase